MASSEMHKASIAMVVGALALVGVILLMALAVKQTPLPDVGDSDELFEDRSPQDVGPAVTIERFMTDVCLNVAGTKECRVSGYVKNTGKSVVEAADLRCFFRSNSGDEVFLDFLLVVDSKLDEIGGGPLAPMSGRTFASRIGDFPDELVPEVVRFEVVNVREREIF